MLLLNSSWWCWRRWLHMKVRTRNRRRNMLLLRCHGGRCFSSTTVGFLKGLGIIFRIVRQTSRGRWRLWDRSGGRSWWWLLLLLLLMVLLSLLLLSHRSTSGKTRQRRRPPLSRQSSAFVGFQDFFCRWSPRLLLLLVLTRWSRRWSSMLLLLLLLRRWVGAARGLVRISIGVGGAHGDEII